MNNKTKPQDCGDHVWIRGIDGDEAECANCGEWYRNDWRKRMAARD